MRKYLLPFGALVACALLAWYSGAILAHQGGVYTAEDDNGVSVILPDDTRCPRLHFPVTSNRVGSECLARCERERASPPSGPVQILA